MDEMRHAARRARQLFLATSITALVASQFPGCGGSGNNGGGTGGSGPSATGGQAASGGTSGTGGATGSGGAGTGGAAPSGGAGGGLAGSGGVTGSGGVASTGGTAGAGGSPGDYVVAMLQSPKAQASEITQDEVVELVTSAVAQAGGLGFISDGQTVVLKPNLVTPYVSYGRKAMEATVNGVSTDWRVTKAVADLVRARNPSGKILVMEGSTVPAETAFSLMGYTAANFGTSVDEFIGFEGSSCSDTSTTGLVQRAIAGGKSFWVNQRYVEADVVISLPTLKTHIVAGITGAVKNLGVGATPVGQYSVRPDGGAPQDCTRGQTADHIDHANPEAIGQFIHDYYRLRPADFVVMDGLQGLQNGPASMWAGTDYATDKMNMRLILAGKNAVAVDTIEALVMRCDPAKVPHLTMLEASGLGTTDVSKITVVGKQVAEVAKPFAGGQPAICPGS
jgi:uncharacterized protein (DUF362 family)